MDKICVWESGKCLKNATLKKWLSAGTWLMGRCHPSIEIGGRAFPVESTAYVNPRIQESWALPWSSSWIQVSIVGLERGQGREAHGWAGKAGRTQIIRRCRSHIENCEFCFRYNWKPLKDSKWRAGSLWVTFQKDPSGCLLHGEGWFGARREAGRGGSQCRR